MSTIDAAIIKHITEGSNGGGGGGFPEEDELYYNEAFPILESVNVETSFVISSAFLIRTYVSVSCDLSFLSLIMRPVFN